MKPKGLGELFAATSDLAYQTGIIEKTDLLIIHKANLTFTYLKKINQPINIGDDSIKN